MAAMGFRWGSAPGPRTFPILRCSSGATGSLSPMGRQFPASGDLRLLVMGSMSYFSGKIGHLGFAIALKQ